MIKQGPFYVCYISNSDINFPLIQDITDKPANQHIRYSKQQGSYGARRDDLVKTGIDPSIEVGKNKPDNH